MFFASGGDWLDGGCPTDFVSALAQFMLEIATKKLLMGICSKQLGRKGIPVSNNFLMWFSGLWPQLGPWGNKVTPIPALQEIVRFTLPFSPLSCLRRSLKIWCEGQVRSFLFLQSPDPQNNPLKFLGVAVAVKQEFSHSCWQNCLASGYSLIFTTKLMVSQAKMIAAK